MNETNLNYYSRNSPVKNKKNLQTGALLSKGPSRSAQVTARPYFAQLSDRIHSQSEAYSEDSYYSHEILIQEDSPDQQMISNQILIVEEEDREQIQVAEYEKIEEENESEMSSSEKQQNDRKLSESSKKNTNSLRKAHYSNGQLSSQKSKHEKRSQSLQNHDENQSKQIFRIFSFGNESEVEKFRMKGSEEEEGSQQQKKEPLIRRLFSSDVLVKVAKSSERKSKENNSDVKSKKSVEKDEKKVEKQAKEDWQQFMINFIKKRSIKQNEINIKEVEEIEEKAQEVSQKNQISAKLSSKGSKSQTSNKSQNKSQNPSEKQDIKLIQIEKSEQNEEKTQQHYNNENDQNEPYFNLQESSILSQTQNQQIKSFFRNSIIQFDSDNEEQGSVYMQSANLILSTVKQLPQQIIPKYIKIYNELLVRQIQGEKALSKQKQIIRMMKMLIEMHKKYLKVDDYLLEEMDKQERVVRMNQEIIMSLVRRLGSVRK